ncbi:hypothetical protein ACJX0J_021895, partial [Zea mays]
PHSSMASLSGRYITTLDQDDMGDDYIYVAVDDAQHCIVVILGDFVLKVFFTLAGISEGSSDSEDFDPWRPSHVGRVISNISQEMAGSLDARMRRHQGDYPTWLDLFEVHIQIHEPNDDCFDVIGFLLRKISDQE